MNEHRFSLPEFLHRKHPKEYFMYAVAFLGLAGIMAGVYGVNFRQLPGFNRLDYQKIATVSSDWFFSFDLNRLGLSSGWTLVEMNIPQPVDLGLLVDGFRQSHGLSADGNVIVLRGDSMLILSGQLPDNTNCLNHPLTKLQKGDHLYFGSAFDSGFLVNKFKGYVDSGTIDRLTMVEGGVNSQSESRLIVGNYRHQNNQTETDSNQYLFKMVNLNLQCFRLDLANNQSWIPLDDSSNY